MPSGQVSVWVPIFVALLAGILGVVGVVIGQLINARRERLREDLRWERERQREEDQRRHDTLVHWREARSAAYSKAYLTMCDLYVVLSHLADQNKRIDDQFEQFVKAASNALTDLAVCASSSVLEQANDLMALLFLHQFGSSGSGDAKHELRRTRPKVAELLNAMRSDLGIESVKDWDIAIRYEAINTSRPLDG